MSMYAKLFTSIYQGTLRGNSHALLVFTNLLAHADKEGIVDMHPKAIAEEVGLTINEVRAALLMLEAPDDESRSPEEQGRRIVRLDEHRAWGWLVVNYVKYRSIRNEDDRREQNREAQERWREKKRKDKSASVSHDKPQSAHTEAEADTKKEIVPAALVASGDGYSVPDCPYNELVAAYHEECPSLPKVRIMTNMRLKHARARWVQVATEDKTSATETLAWFRKFFAMVERQDFLTGRCRNNNGRPWTADFEWLMNAGNFAKVVEGRYTEDKK